MNKGFFLLHRDLWEKEWFLGMDSEQQMTLINIIRLANWKPNKLRDGTMLQPGQIAISIRKFSAKLRTTPRRLRTLLTVCSNVGFSTHDATQGYTVITIVNWHIYQAYNDAIDTASDTRATQSRHTSDTDLTKKQLTSNNKDLRDLPEPKQKDVSDSSRKPKIGFDFETKKFTGIDQSHIDLWKEAYPAIDVIVVLKSMAAWLIANPKNKKTNYSRFITNWLKREQDAAPRVDQGKKTAPRADSSGKTDETDYFSYDQVLR